jgi:cytochrome oxidase Cu insertion factor (SCO1/SenC/PrrC family)
MRLGDLPASWRDDLGRAFDLHAMQGRAVVLTMAYATCHRVCPVTIRDLQQLQQDFDRRGLRAEFIVVGYDPDADDPAAWHQYRRTRHLTRENWHFLVGTPADVQRIARQLGFEFWKMDEHVIHDSRIVRFDEHGTLIATDAAAGLRFTLR